MSANCRDLNGHGLPPGILQAFASRYLWRYVQRPGQHRRLVTLGRLLIAAVFGAVIGYERERAGKIAGLRTHTLVALGAALFTVASVLLYSKFPSINGVTGYDYHIVANIIVGIGFIGAGAILRNGERISGTTTAATLWVVAAIGMTAGFGFYKEALATTVLVYATLDIFWRMEKKMRKSPHYGHEHPESKTVENGSGS
jgi:putative Mg2+ transporter-C (MgtC) family protein